MRISSDELRAAADRLLPPKIKLVVCIYDPDGFSAARRTITRMDRQQIINRIGEGYRFIDKIPQTEKEVINCLALASGAEAEDGTAWVETIKEYRQRQEKELREECGQLAGEICARYKVKANTFAFIRAAVKHYKGISKSERHFRDDGEMRAERWAEAMHNGCRDAYFEDNDYASSRIAEADSDLRKLMRYLHRYCPLLMARYKELRLKRKQKQ